MFIKPMDFALREYASGDYDRIQNLWAQTGLGSAARGDNQ